MTNKIRKNKPPVWFWIVSIVAIIWNGMGVFQYLQQAYNTERFQAMYNEEQLLVIENTPSWAISAFAIAVFAGLLGTLALLFRKKIARPLFLLSLIGIIVQMIYNLFISNAIEVYGSGAIAMPIMVLVFGIALLWVSKTSASKGWIS